MPLQIPLIYRRHPVLRFSLHFANLQAGVKNNGALNSSFLLQPENRAQYGIHANAPWLAIRHSANWEANIELGGNRGQQIPACQRFWANGGSRDGQKEPIAAGGTSQHIQPGPEPLERAAAVIYFRQIETHKKIEKAKFLSSQLAFIPPAIQTAEISMMDAGDNAGEAEPESHAEGSLQVLLSECWSNHKTDTAAFLRWSLEPLTREENEEIVPWPWWSDALLARSRNEMHSQPQSNSNLAVAAQQHFIATYPRVLIESFKYNVSDTSNYERSVTEGNEKDVKFRW